MDIRKKFRSSDKGLQFAKIVPSRASRIYHNNENVKSAEPQKKASRITTINRMLKVAECHKRYKKIKIIDKIPRKEIHQGA